MANRDPDIDLTIIAGAGASTGFGLAGNPLPLMSGWSESLVAAISKLSGAHLELSGLERGLDGPTFEERLGELLQLVVALPRVERILDPSLRVPGAINPIASNALKDWHRNTQFQLEQIVAAIHRSLFEEFGRDRIDFGSAREGYRALLDQLGVANRPWVFATTNYDWLGDAAVESVGRLADAGEVRRATGGETSLIPDGLIDGIGRFVPVLHLHGRLGWYRRPGTGDAYVSGSTMHDDNFGVPLVMLPDPQKVYSDPILTSLWIQFESALSRSRRVLVLGHSLNDPLLVQAIRSNVSDLRRVAVSVLPDGADETQVHPLAHFTARLVDSQLAGAQLIRFRFGSAHPNFGPNFQEWTARINQIGHVD